MERKQLGPWCFNPTDFSITDEKQRIELEPLLCKLLIFFADNPRRIISRQELVDTIWQQSYVDDNAINRAISELRKILQHPALTQSPIKTHHRKGYSLQLEPSTIDISATTQTVITAKSVKTSNTAKTFRLLPVIALAIILLITLIASLWYWWPTTNPVSQTSLSADQTEMLTLDIRQHTKVTWYKGIESRPLVSPEKNLLAYNHTMPSGQMRTVIRKLGNAIGITSQEVVLEQADMFVVAQTWQPESNNLLVQYFSKDGQQCQYYRYDFQHFPRYERQLISNCQGIGLTSAQLSQDGSILYRNQASSGMFSANSLVAENLQTGVVSTLVDAPSAGLGVTILGISPDGSKLAYVFMPESNKPEIFLYSPDSREHRRLVTLPFAMLLIGLEWSADQQHLYIPGTDAIIKLALDTAKLSILRLPDNIKASELSLVTENSAFISALNPAISSQNAMQIVRIQHPFDNEKRSISPVNDGAGSTMSISFDPSNPERYAFSANWNGGWQLWLSEQQHTTVLTEFSDNNQMINGLSWSPDGRFLAFIKQAELYLYDLQQKQVIQKTFDLTVGQPVWRPDGKALIFTRVQANNQNLWQLDLITNQLNQLTFSSSSYAQFDQQGQLYYSREGKLYQWVDGKRQDIAVPSVEDNTSYMPFSFLQQTQQYRFSLLGHLIRQPLGNATGSQHTQLTDHQLLMLHFNPHNTDELYATVFITPELALEYIEWHVEK